MWLAAVRRRSWGVASPRRGRRGARAQHDPRTGQLLGPCGAPTEITMPDRGSAISSRTVCASGDSGTRWGIPFFAFGPGIVQIRSARSNSFHCRTDDLTLPLAGDKLQFQCETDRFCNGQIGIIERAPERRYLVRAQYPVTAGLFAGGLYRGARVRRMMSRDSAQPNMRRIMARVRFAAIGEPRSTIPSSSAITSRRAMLLALRRPQAGITSLRKMRSSSAAERLRGRAHLSR